MGRFGAAIDRALLAVAPGAACRRLASRSLYQQLESRTRRFEGASRGRRTKNWRTPTTDANAAIASSIVTLRSRARDLVRNNPWAGRAVRAISAYTVGTGLRPSAMGGDAQAKRVEAAWKQWATSPFADRDGCADFYGLQDIVVRGMAESGSVLIRRHRESKGSIPLSLQVLEPDHLDSTRREGLDDNPVIHGVELDKVTHERVAYWLFPDHPGSSWPMRLKFESERVPASEVLHIYRRDRPGQIEGVPWGAATIVLLRNFDEYQDAQVVRQLLGACFTGFVKGVEMGPDAGNSALGTGPNGDAPLQELEPGAILHLENGQDITFSKPPEVEGYGEFSAQTLRAVAAGYDVPYEVLSQDLSQVNFSSGRMGGNDFQRRVEQWQRFIVIPQMLDSIWTWFLEAAAVAPNVAVGVQDMTVGVRWTPPGRVQIDPVKEGKALTDAVRSGFKTWGDAVREQGHDPEEQLAAIAEQNKLFDEFDVKLECDPRHFSPPGSTPIEEPEETSAAPDDEK